MAIHGRTGSYAIEKRLQMDYSMRRCANFEGALTIAVMFDFIAKGMEVGIRASSAQVAKDTPSASAKL